MEDLNCMIRKNMIICLRLNTFIENDTCMYVKKSNNNLSAKVSCNTTKQ